MEGAFDSNTLSMWLLEYGSIGIFILLTLGIIALPVPEETLMVISGILMHNHKLCIPPTLAAAYLGAIAGITGSYLIGRTAGYYFIPKYGPWIGLTPERVEKVHNWFERFGKWTLVIGYFIPGIRHFTGLIAGSTQLSYKQFALFAYSGAILWVSSFLSIGYFFGAQWLTLFNRFKEIEVEFDWITIGIIGILIALGIYAVYKARHFRF